MPERVHSSDIQLFIDDQRIPSVTSLDFSSEKDLTDLNRLGASHVVDRVLNSNQSTNIDIDVRGVKGAAAYNVTTISGGVLTSYSINGSVGDIAKGSTSYVGDGAIFTNAGSLSASDQSNDIHNGFFKPRNIEITSTTDGDEGIDSATLNIQNFSISVDIGRNPVTRLGTRVPKFRYPEMPAAGSLDFGILKTNVTGINISSLICESGVIKIEL